MFWAKKFTLVGASIGSSKTAVRTSGAFLTCCGHTLKKLPARNFTHLWPWIRSANPSKTKNYPCLLQITPQTHALWLKHLHACYKLWPHNLCPSKCKVDKTKEKGIRQQLPDRFWFLGGGIFLRFALLVKTDAPMQSIKCVVTGDGYCHFPSSQRCRRRVVLRTRDLLSFLRDNRDWLACGCSCFFLLWYRRTNS